MEGDRMKMNRSLEFEVFSEVYTPAEDTMLLLDCIAVEEGQRVLEMGCGSGLIALHCADAGAKVTAADIDPMAVMNTSRNAERNGVRMNVVHSDLFDRIEDSFDLLIFNPPYLEGEVKGQEDLCWAGGAHGLDVLERFLVQARGHLREEGRIVMIVSSDMDADALETVLAPFVVKELCSKNVFFEELTVLELRPSG